MQKDNLKNETPTDANNVLAVVLIDKLDTLIESCKNQAKEFENADLTISESCSLAMMQAYMNIREFVQNNR
jgi:hypothetical protein